MLIEIAKGKVSNRGIIIQDRNLAQHLSEKEELFRSYFGFDEKIQEHIASGKSSPAGYIGEFFIKQIILDVDRGDQSLEDTIQRTRNLVNRLIKEYDLEDNFQIWFSGTGFHIHLPDIFGFTPSNDLPDIVRATLESHFPEVDLKPVQPRGLIRVGRSYNSKSGLYKIPIRESEIWFLTEEQVLQWAKAPRKEVSIQKTEAPLKLFEKVIPAKKSTQVMIPTLRPNRIVTCMQHCYNAGAVKGKRHERMLPMISWMHRQGIPAKACYAAMKMYVGEGSDMTDYEIEKYVNDVYVKGGYEYGCSSKVMSEFCDPQCIFASKKNYLPEVFGHKEIEENYKTEMEKGWEDSALNLAPFLGIIDERGYWLRPGHMIGLIADSGLSKSALLQNLALTFKSFGDFVYVNTEMPYEELFERFIQIEYGMTNFDVREHYANGGVDLSKPLKHIKYTKSVPNYDGIIELVKKTKPKVLMIDVIDDVKPGKNRDVNSQEDMYAGLKSLAVEYKMIVFLVHHISKAAAIDERGNSKTLTKHSAKGSSAFEQKCDIMIGVEGNPDTPYRILRHLKGRSTTPFVASFKVDPNTFQYQLQSGRR